MSASESLSSQWPTPQTADVNMDRGGQEYAEMKAATSPYPNLAVAAKTWPTPAVTDSNGARNRIAERSNPDSKHHDGVTLNDAIPMWSTPRASDGEKGGPNQSFGAGGIPLPTQSVSFHQAHPIYPIGGIPSKERRSLNPLFVEWLMGWPPGWTLLAWTDFACSATELFAWKARMRSALSQLGLPPPAPLVQRDLFAQWS